MMSMRLFFSVLVMVFLFALMPITTLAQEATEEAEIVIVDAPETVALAEPATMSYFQWFQVVWMIAIIGIAGYWAWKQGGDVAVVTTLEEVESSRGQMEVLERAYQGSGKPIQLAFDNFTEFVLFVSNFTVMRSDDTLARLMKDIQTPGAPEALPDDEETVDAEPFG